MRPLQGMPMEKRVEGAFELSTDGHRFWLNHESHGCLARFSYRGWEVYQKPKVVGQGFRMDWCCYCRNDAKLDMKEWENFRAHVQKVYGVEVPVEWLPEDFCKPTLSDADCAQELQ